MDIQIEEKESIFIQLKKNKPLIFLLIIALALGLYLRFDDYGAEGYLSDCMNTIPAAVFAYYPHDYFPGLVSTEPPLGNYIIGLGCLASGEDFSQVKNVKPLFFPDRSAYIGKAAKNSEKYCFVPIYIFSVLFLIGIIIFAFSFFDILSSALYLITFFAFSSLAISISRSIHVDIFLLTFLVFALLFLWKAYKSDKGVLKEKLYLAASFGFFGLAGATKFTAGAYIIFAFLLLAEKYVYEILYLTKNLFNNIGLEGLAKKLENVTNINIKAFFTNLLVSVFSCLFFLMAFFNFSFKNLKDTHYYMTTLNFPGSGGISFSLNNLSTWFGHFLLKLNILDVFIFLFSFFILFKLVLKKDKTKIEKFTLYLSLFSITVLLFFKVVATSISRSFPFGFILLIPMALAFSDEKYSLLRILKIKKKHFIIFLSIYILVSFFTLYYSPFHHHYNNPLICPILGSRTCEHFKHLSDVKPVAQYFETILKNDETFLPTGIYNFYTRHNDDILWWIFYSNFKKQTGKEPRLGDYLKYYNPEGRRVRYVFTDTSLETNPNDLVGLGIDQDILKKEYKPDHIIKVYGKNTSYIYDLDNLIKK